METEWWRNLIVAYFAACVLNDIVANKNLSATTRPVAAVMHTLLAIGSYLWLRGV